MTNPHPTESLLRAALENIHAMLGTVLTSSETAGNMHLVYKSYQAAEAALAVADKTEEIK